MGVETNSSSQLIQALAQLSPIIFGSGDVKKSTTTTKSTKGTTKTNVDQKAIQALTELLSSSATNPDMSSETVRTAQKNIIDNILRSNVPSVGAAERGAGIYNASNTKQSLDRILAEAVNQSAQYELNLGQEAAKLKQGVAATLGEATKSTTVSGTDTTTDKIKASEGPVINPLISAGALGAGILAANWSDWFGSDSKKKDSNNDYIGTPNLSSASFATPPQFQPVTSAFESIVRPDESFLTTSLSNFTSDVAANLNKATVSPTGQVRSGGWDDFTGAITSAGLSAGINALGSMIFGGGSNSGSSSSSGGTVICTRLNELGYLSDTIYAYDAEYGEYLAEHNPKLMAWYHSWAIPFVEKYMHNTTLLSKVINKLLIIPVYIWSAYMYFQVKRLVEISHG